MLGLLVVAVATAAAMALLVAFSSFLFRDNRTRQERRDPPARLRPTAVPDAAVWHTVVEPGDGASARSFANAYARAMTVTDAESELPGHQRPDAA